MSEEISLNEAAIRQMVKVAERNVDLDEAGRKEIYIYAMDALQKLDVSGEELDSAGLRLAEALKI